MCIDIIKILKNTTICIKKKLKMENGKSFLIKVQNTRKMILTKIFNYLSSQITCVFWMKWNNPLATFRLNGILSILGG